MEGKEERARYLTSNERRKQHAERHKLRELKRDQRKQNVKRKVLKLEEDVVKFKIYIAINMNFKLH